MHIDPASRRRHLVAHDLITRTNRFVTITGIDIFARFNPGFFASAGPVAGDEWAIEGDFEFIGRAGPYDLLPLRVATLERIFPGDQRAASQPIRFVRGNEPPMWLAVAENDTVVEPGNTDRFARALQNAGDSVVVTRYRHLTHAALVGVLGAPLRRAASVLDDLSAFVERAGGASNAGVASSDAKPRAATVASPVSAQ